MLKIGLTGGIGSGKSLVSEIFGHLGIPVFNADREAAEILNHDPAVHIRLAEWFGSDILAGGMPDRQRIAAVVFSDPGELARLNGLIHPGVMQRFAEWAEANAGQAYGIHEAAILFETGLYRAMDKNILVSAPESLRLRRVMDRDHISEEAVSRRMQNQWSDDRKIALADFVVENDEKRLLVPQILKIHNLLIDNLL